MVNWIKKLVLGSALVALAACSNEGRIDVSSGVGVRVVRSGCPAVAVAAYTGDITIFNPANSKDASAIDTVANITNVRSTCNSEGSKIYSEASFDVYGLRARPGPARTVTIPYYTTVVQGSTAVVSKRISAVTLQFADGALRAQSSAKAGSFIDAAAARLPEDIVDRITRKRKAGDADAALDPLADPTVRAAVTRSTFEMLIGFQLTPDQLQYNATR